MGYITYDRGGLTQNISGIPQGQSPFPQPEVEVHYYCDRCGSWDVASIGVRPEAETALGCAKYAVLGFLLGGIAFWPLWLLAVALMIAIVIYEKRTKTKETDYHRCNHCGLEWDQVALLESNPRGYRYIDYISSE